MICFDLAKKGTVIFINARPCLPTSGQLETGMCLVMPTQLRKTAGAHGCWRWLSDITGTPDAGFQAVIFSRLASDFLFGTF